MDLSDLPPEYGTPFRIVNSTGFSDLQAAAGRPHNKIPLSNVEAVPFILASSYSRVGDLRTCMAVLPEHFEAAGQLVRRRYAWRGYRMPSTEGLDGGALRRDNQCITLLAENQGKLLGTLTVRLDSPAGLLAEENYGTEIKDARNQGRRIAEITRLAMEERAEPNSALDALVQSAYLVTHIVHSLTHVFIEVNPRHVRFYQRVLGFVVAASQRLCQRVDAPAVLMQLDLAEFGQRLRPLLS